MRASIISALFLLYGRAALSQTVPPGWQVIKDTKGACQITVPREWTPLGDNLGAAVFHDATTAIAVVTSQPGQEFKPLTPALVKVIGIGKDSLFENTARRIFYQQKKSHNADDTSAFDSSIPGKGGVCSCHIVVLPRVSDEVAKKIALSLSPAPDKT